MNRHKLMIFFLFLISLNLDISNVLAGKTLFDDFSSVNLDASKWRQRTFVRETVNEQFVSALANRSPGMDAEITPGIFRNDLSFKNANSINSIECDIEIVETKLDSALNSTSFARIGGSFYNINAAGDATGDIFAQIMIGDRGNGGLEAFWTVAQMLSENPETWQLIGSGTVIGPGTLEYDTEYKVKISYDGKQTFSFFANGQGVSPFLGPARRRASVSPFKALSTGIDATNGSNNGFVAAIFDNVYINDEVLPYDNFITSPLQVSKWRSLETVRKILNGSLHSYQQGVNQGGDRSTYLTEVDCPFMEAKVRLTSDSQLSSGAYGVARIQGYFYNESRGPGSGQSHNEYEDDVFAEVRLEYHSDGSLSAKAFVRRSNNADQTDWTRIFSHDFNTIPIYLDTDYTISIRYTSSQLIFNCNDEEAKYDISTPTYRPYGEHRALRTRIELDPGESGYMKALFDDVYIEKKDKMAPAIPLLLLDES